MLILLYKLNLYKTFLAKIIHSEYLFIASYYRQLSVDIKIKRLKPVWLAPRSRILGQFHDLSAEKLSVLRDYTYKFLCMADDRF